MARSPSRQPFGAPSGHPLGPGEADLRLARQPSRPVQRGRSGAEEDAALLLASRDRGVAAPGRALAWLAWAYGRSPLRPVPEVLDAFWGLDGLLPPLLRRLAFAAIGRAGAGQHRAATAGQPAGSSRWRGVLVALLLWAGLAWGLLATILALGGTI